MGLLTLLYHLVSKHLRPYLNAVCIVSLASDYGQLVHSDGSVRVNKVDDYSKMKLEANGNISNLQGIIIGLQSFQGTLHLKRNPSNKHIVISDYFDLYLQVFWSSHIDKTM